MSLRLAVTVGVVLVAVTTALTAHVVRTGDGSVAVDDRLPAEPRAILEKLAGVWQGQATVWSDGAAEPTKTVLDVDYRWILGGRFLSGEYRGVVSGGPFEGREVLGYDTVRGEFQSFWIDNRTTAFTVARGSYDKATRVLSFDGTQDDVSGGRRDRPFRLEYDLVTDGQFKMTIFRDGGGGELIRSAEIVAGRIR